jgi:hypothetical protein
MKHVKRVADVGGRACLVLVLAVSLPAFSGFARASDAGPKVPEKQAAPSDAAQEAPALAGPKEKLSYALGMSLGNQFRSQSIEVDPGIYLQGLRDALSGGKTLLTEREARAVVVALQSELKKKQAARKAPGAVKGIAVSFKVDSRLTKGLYMGDRWVSPPTFTSTLQEGKEIIVEARVHGVDANGNTMKIMPKWTPSDPGMVAVTPGEGSEVSITVKRAGKSTLNVAAAGVSKEVTIKAIGEGNALQVEITQ